MLPQQIAHRGSYHEATQQYIQVPLIEHLEDFSCGTAEHLADAYLLAAILALKHRESEHANDTDEDSQQRE